MNVFIDTNIFLSFYHFTGEDLEELKKLVALVDKKEIILCLPEQVVNEFWRNRESKISAAISDLTKANFNLRFPQMCKYYSEYSKIQVLQNEYENLHASLIKNIKKDAVECKLSADQIVTKIFANSTPISTNDEYITLARKRIGVGNPPGKNGSLGDAINWEVLLRTISSFEDIYFISEDSDYCSAIDSSRMKEYLLKEWGNKKSSSIYFYKKISDFFREKFPYIKLASDVEKYICIQNLAKSGSFSRTHAIVAELAQFEEMSIDQTCEILNICKSNNQVRWILTDSDVKDYVRTLISKYESKLDGELVNSIRELMAREDGSDVENIDDTPF